MRILCLLVALLMLSVTAGAQSWSTYTSEDGHFRVDMPGTPELSVEPVKLKGNRTVFLNRATARAGAAVYAVAYSDYPSGTLAGLAPMWTLERERDGAAKAKGNTLLRSKPITIGGNPGLEYVIAVNQPNSYTGVVRATLVGLRLYQVIYSAPGLTEPITADMPHFLDSFALN